jgi:lysophospholipase L1-like esterase
MRCTLLVAVVLLLAGHLVGPRRARAATAPIKVACVGDSITQSSGWSDKLGVKLGAGYTSTNYGVSGTTLLKKGDNPYWGTAAYTQSHASNPDIVVIMLGTNDSKPFNWNAHKGEFVGDYEALIDSYAALPSHPRIYLNLCPPAGTNGYQIVGSVIENEVIPDIKQVAATKGLPTIDVFTAFGGHSLDQSLYGSPADLVHPNDKGAQVIADTVYAALTAVEVQVDAGSVDASAPKDATSGADAAEAGSSMGGATASGGAAGSGAGGAAGGSAGAGGASGTAGAAGASGAVGAAGNSGGGAAGGVAGTAASPGAARTGASSAHASSGGCAVAASSGHSPWASVLVLGLAALRGVRARRRARLS